MIESWQEMLHPRCRQNPRNELSRSLCVVPENRHITGGKKKKGKKHQGVRAVVSDFGRRVWDTGQTVPITIQEIASATKEQKRLLQYPAREKFNLRRPHKWTRGGRNMNVLLRTRDGIGDVDTDPHRPRVFELDDGVR